jgi:hypothetical protein
VPDHLFSSHLLNRVVSGWTTSGIYQLGSGLPFNISSPETDQMGEIYGSRINANSTFHDSPGFKRTLSEYFDVTKYSSPLLGRYGNTNKSPERTPYIQNFDANFGKNTHIAESMNLLIRLDVFNLGGTWHSPYSPTGQNGSMFPQGNLTASNFGELINTNYGNVSLWNPHVLQLTGQITF